MFKRFQRYYENFGPVQTLIFLGVMIFLIYRQLQYGTVLARAIMTTFLIAGFFAPLPLMGLCERNPHAASKTAKYLQYLILAFIVINYFNVYTFPGYIYFLFLLSIFVFIGWSFWFFSSPRVATARGGNYDHSRALAQEEMYLNQEIANNEKLLERDQEQR
jgi:hypothetical protein